MTQEQYKKGEPLKVLELFAGTRSIGKAFDKKGHKVFSIDYSNEFENIDLYEDIENITPKEILEKFGKPDIIWASPDCTTYSIAAISHHRNKVNGNLEPKSEYAKKCDLVNKNVLKLIEELKPKYFFIENPRGGMRKMDFMKHLPRFTVTYCQYGDDRMKPTDIWTNHPNPNFKPMCKNGDKCHQSAPRGSKTGTQGLKGSKERSIIPERLCNHIVNICENTNPTYEEHQALIAENERFREALKFYAHGKHFYGEKNDVTVPDPEHHEWIGGTYAELIEDGFVARQALNQEKGE